MSDDDVRVQHRMVDVGDGLTLHAAIAGDGPPLVLLHGFTGSTQTWTPLRATLGAAHTLIAVDLAGHGRSSAPEDPARYALPRFADDLARLLDAFRLDRVALLGYSMGGRAALHAALRHPARVSALVLESTSAGMEHDAERAARVAADAELAEFIEREGVDAFVARWEALPLWASQRQLDDDGRARLRAQRRVNSMRGLAHSLRGAGAGAEPSVMTRLAESGAPTLLVAGALDEKYVANGRAMARAMPNARLAIIAGAGHAVHLERATELAALVLEFLHDPIDSSTRHMWHGAPPDRDDFEEIT